MEYVLIALSIIIVALLIALLYKASSKKDNKEIGQEEIQRIVREELVRAENEIRNQIENSNMRQAQTITTSFSDTNRLVLQNMDGFVQTVKQGNERIALSVNENLDKINKSVNEQLAENLQSRLDSSYKKVSDSLERITKWLGEMQELASGVTDLKKVLSGVKTRGEWGEASLDAILEQLLTVDQYKKQITISGQNAVDFAIILPGKGANDSVLLPIDAKFPSEDYQRICECSEAGDNAGVELARKALSARVKHEAIEIKNKYVRVPKTTDFAVMYVPTEGLFAEILRIPGLSDELARNKVVLSGPTTITALLNSLRMGFRTLAIEKRSTEIGKLLGSFQKDFALYSKALEVTKTRLDGAREKLDEVVSRSAKIQARLSKVESMPGVEEDTLPLIGEADNDM